MSPSTDHIEAFTWSNSTLRQLRKCEQAFKYHYVDLLESSSGSYAMERGSWFHHCLAAENIGIGLKEETLLEVPTEIDLRMAGVANPEVRSDCLRLGQREFPLSAFGMLSLLTEFVYDVLPEEVRGDKDLPGEIGDLLLRYFDHWNRDYEVLMVETRWNRKSDKGVWFTGALDLVKRTDRGLVVISDTKTHAALPDAAYRLTDSQLHHYAWGIEEKLAEYGLTAAAVEFDYVVTKPPVEVTWTLPKPPPKRPTKTNPEQLSKPARLTATVTKSTNIDSWTLRKGFELKQAELDQTALKEDVEPWEMLIDWEGFEAFYDKVKEREKNGESPFFSRALMPRSSSVINTLLSEHHTTVARGRAILKGAAPRHNVDFFGCRQCPYTEICVGELYGNDVFPLRGQFNMTPLPLYQQETPA